ncbi:Calmodulin-regulated spectrin-associated protein 2 [Gonapodya sp. JEL0774]|nr:Calmodulin-regulated spectrin-associated protein 2 [Gonapodya sp. JEL0774]
MVPALPFTLEHQVRNLAFKVYLRSLLSLLCARSRDTYNADVARVVSATWPGWLEEIEYHRIKLSEVDPDTDGEAMKMIVRDLDLAPDVVAKLIQTDPICEEAHIVVMERVLDKCVIVDAQIVLDEARRIRSELLSRQANHTTSDAADSLPLSTHFQTWLHSLISAVSDRTPTNLASKDLLVDVLIDPHLSRALILTYPGAYHFGPLFLPSELDSIENDGSKMRLEEVATRIASVLFVECTHKGAESVERQKAVDLSRSDETSLKFVSRSERIEECTHSTYANMLTEPEEDKPPNSSHVEEAQPASSHAMAPSSVNSSHALLRVRMPRKKLRELDDAKEGSASHRASSRKSTVNSHRQLPEHPAIMEHHSTESPSPSFTPTLLYECGGQGEVQTDGDEPALTANNSEHKGVFQGDPRGAEAVECVISLKNLEDTSITEQTVLTDPARHVLPQTNSLASSSSPNSISTVSPEIDLLDGVEDICESTLSFETSSNIQKKDLVEEQICKNNSVFSLSKDCGKLCGGEAQLAASELIYNEYEGARTIIIDREEEWFGEEFPTDLRIRNQAIVGANHVEKAPGSSELLKVVAASESSLQSLSMDSYVPTVVTITDLPAQTHGSTMSSQSARTTVPTFKVRRRAKLPRVPSASVVSSSLQELHSYDATVTEVTLPESDGEIPSHDAKVPHVTVLDLEAQHCHRHLEPTIDAAIPELPSSSMNVFEEDIRDECPPTQPDVIPDRRVEESGWLKDVSKEKIGEEEAMPEVVADAVELDAEEASTPAPKITLPWQWIEVCNKLEKVDSGPMDNLQMDDLIPICDAPEDCTRDQHENSRELTESMMEPLKEGEIGRYPDNLERDVALELTDNTSHNPDHLSEDEILFNQTLVLGHTDEDSVRTSKGGMAYFVSIQDEKSTKHLNGIVPHDLISLKPKEHHSMPQLTSEASWEAVTRKHFVRSMKSVGGKSQQTKINQTNIAEPSLTKPSDVLRPGVEEVGVSPCVPKSVCKGNKGTSEKKLKHPNSRVDSNATLNGSAEEERLDEGLQTEKQRSNSTLNDRFVTLERRVEGVNSTVQRVEPESINATTRTTAKLKVPSGNTTKSQLAINPIRPSSTRALIKNALQSLLAGAINEAAKREALEAIDSSSADNFVIAVKEERDHKFRALYELVVERGPSEGGHGGGVASVRTRKLCGTGPPTIDERSVEAFLKYDTGLRQLRVLPTKGFGGSTHAVAIGGKSGSSTRRK